MSTTINRLTINFGTLFQTRGAAAIISHTDEAVKGLNCKGSIVKFIINMLD